MSNVSFPLRAITPTFENTLPTTRHRSRSPSSDGQFALSCEDRAVNATPNCGLPNCTASQKIRGDGDADLIPLNRSGRHVLPAPADIGEEMMKIG
jgi:hypothetical protein